MGHGFPAATPESHRIPELWLHLCTKLMDISDTWRSGNGHLLTALVCRQWNSCPVPSVSSSISVEGESGIGAAGCFTCGVPLVRPHLECLVLFWFLRMWQLWAHQGGQWAAAFSMLWELEGTDLKPTVLGPEQPDPTGIHLTSLYSFPAMQAYETHSRRSAPSGWACSPSCGPEEHAEVLGHEQRHPETLLSPPHSSQMASGLPVHGATWLLLWGILGCPEMTNMWCLGTQRFSIWRAVFSSHFDTIISWFQM